MSLKDRFCIIKGSASNLDFKYIFHQKIYSISIFRIVLHGLKIKFDFKLIGKKKEFHFVFHQPTAHSPILCAWKATCGECKKMTVRVVCTPLLAFLSTLGNRAVIVHPLHV